MQTSQCYRMYLEYCSNRTICLTPKPQCLLLERDRDYSESETWRITIDFNLSTYHEVISIVKADIFTVEQQ
jgi:hypothetical protein